MILTTKNQIFRTRNPQSSAVFCGRLMIYAMEQSAKVGCGHTTEFRQHFKRKLLTEMLIQIGTRRVQFLNMFEGRGLSLVQQEIDDFVEYSHASFTVIWMAYTPMMHQGTENLLKVLLSVDPNFCRDRRQSPFSSHFKIRLYNKSWGNHKKKDK